MKAPQSITASQYRSLFLFLLFFSLYLLPFMHFLRQGTDEGQLVYGAVRVAQGQVLGRDFFEVVAPGTFYWLALFFRLFGITFLAARICLFLTSLGIGLLMYSLSRRICNKYWIVPCILLAATWFGMLWPTISHHVDSNFLALLCVACVLRWLDTRKTYLLFAAGAVAAATTFVLQPKGVFLLLALLLWLALQTRRRTVLLRLSAALVAGYGSVVTVVLAYFWRCRALAALLDANLIWPFRHYGSINAVPYAHGLFGDYWHPWTTTTWGIPWPYAIAAVLIAPFLFIATLPLLLLILSAWRRRELRRPELLLYTLCGWAIWWAEFHRKDIYHLAFGAPLLIIVCVYYLEQWRGNLARVSLQMLTISSACLALFNLLLVLSAHPMSTRVGSVAVFQSDPVLAQLQQKVAPGDEIFVYPYAPMYYFLSATTNPTRFSGLTYNYNSAPDFQSVTAVLEQRHVQFVVWDTGFDQKALKTFYPAARPAALNELIVEPYLQSHYKVILAAGDLHLLERNQAEK